jgi:hypothetical protein
LVVDYSLSVEPMHGPAILIFNCTICTLLLYHYYSVQEP